MRMKAYLYDLSNVLCWQLCLAFTPTELAPDSFIPKVASLALVFEADCRTNASSFMQSQNKLRGSLYSFEQARLDTKFMGNA